MQSYLPEFLFHCKHKDITDVSSSSVLNGVITNKKINQVKRQYSIIKKQMIGKGMV